MKETFQFGLQSRNYFNDFLCMNYIHTTSFQWDKENGLMSGIASEYGFGSSYYVLPIREGPLLYEGIYLNVLKKAYTFHRLNFKWIIAFHSVGKWALFLIFLWWINSRIGTLLIPYFLIFQWTFFHQKTS